METLPPVILGAIILTAFTTVGVLRPFVEKRIVITAPAAEQPKRQIALDVLLCLLAGVIGAALNTILFDFPVPSAVSLLIGCAVLGFFIAIDMALERERRNILNAIDVEQQHALGDRYFPVTRKFFLVAVSTTVSVTIVIVLVISRDIVWLAKIGQTGVSLAEAQLSVSYEIFFIMAILLAMVLNLIFSYSKNLKLLFQNETGILEKVSRGDLSAMVPVATNDEFGFIAAHTNSMIEGLRHRIRLIAGLKLAEEVQRNLLPDNDPDIDGLDISGTSIYCDETGGDYYDYLPLPGDRLGIVVVDAADHGVGAALHMATTRAFLRYGTQKMGALSEMIDNVNQHLVRDSQMTGRFVSLFLLEIDPNNKALRWVRAGHEPAWVYEPRKDSFQSLDGAGIALGIDDEYRFQSYSQASWDPGSVILIATDGIHEARNDSDEMFGRQRLKSILRDSYSRNAAEIQTEILAAVTNFRGAVPQDDDITLVVVKFSQ